MRLSLHLPIFINQSASTWIERSPMFINTRLVLYTGVLGQCYANNIVIWESLSIVGDEGIFRINEILGSLEAFFSGGVPKGNLQTFHTLQHLWDRHCLCKYLGKRGSAETFLLVRAYVLAALSLSPFLTPCSLTIDPSSLSHDSDNTDLRNNGE